MKLTRSALALTVGALAPALLLATPALAAGPAAAAPVKAAAVTAGESPYDTMSDADLRVEVARILAANPGRGVTREANKALDGTTEDVRTFLKTGLAKAQDEDNRVAIAKILFANPATGKAVKREATKALDGTAADRAAFLKTGLRLAQAEDDRVDVARILARPGISDALRAEAIRLLDGGTPEELRYFITVGQYRL
ncbi:ALF repeat-containing protein [Streptomyces avidinii]|uniref:ALF repeat-containing protein n=1 Tax=Streptomyces avidinii TaxID=1895 RepID=UPI003867BA3C|nr:ALF repeat-containing protein [Streptomyces avidinii]